VIKGKGTKTVKEKFVFDFTAEWPSEELFACPKANARSDVTVLTQAALDKEVL
jgi:hypothetical protein